MPNQPKSKSRPWLSSRCREENNKMQLRPRSDNLYHTARWTKESKAFREENPLCATCLKEGIIHAAEAVDHVVPYPLCDFWDKTNWAPICRKHNIQKGNRDKKLLHERGII